MVDAKTDQEVPDTGRVGAQRVIAAWLGGVSMSEEIGRHDGVVLGQQLNRLVPLRGTAGNAVDQHNRGAFSGNVEVHAVAVERNLHPFDRRNRPDVP